MPARVLLVDDDPVTREYALHHIRGAVPVAETEEAADPECLERAFGLPEFDAVLAHTTLGWSTGQQVLGAARERWPDTPIVLYSGTDDEDLAEAVASALASSLRRRARKATETLLRTMFEQSLAGLYVGTVEGGVVECNPAFARLFGYDSPEEMRGRPPTEFVPDPRQVEDALAQMVAQGGVMTNVEAMARRRDGSTFRAMYSARFHELDGTRLVIGTVVDMTESHRAREELRQAAREWRTTFDGISSPILAVRPDGTVVRINAAGRALAGQDYTAIIGQAVDRIAEGEPWRSAAELVRTLGAHAGQRSATVHDQDTGSTWEMSAFPTGLPGTADQLISLVLRDISEVVGLQESVVRGQTLSALGQLIAGVAHEVRSPLFGISATLDAFDARFGAEAAFRPYLDHLRRELERMNSLMRELLNLGRPAETPREPVSIGRVIAEAIAVTDALAREHGVTIRETLPPATAVRLVLADQPRLVQVFENLLTNAIQHAPGKSEIVIAEASRRAAPAELTLAVVDRGPGFRTEDLSHLFEPFFTRRTGGTGLGLAIVRRIVEDHGGAVRAENVRSGGASVLVTLPVHDGGRGSVS